MCMGALGSTLEKGNVSTVLPRRHEEWPLLVVRALPPGTCHSAILASHLAGEAAAMVSRAHR